MHIQGKQPEGSQPCDNSQCRVLTSGQNSGIPNGPNGNPMATNLAFASYFYNYSNNMGSCVQVSYVQSQSASSNGVCQLQVVTGPGQNTNNNNNNNNMIQETWNILALGNNWMLLQVSSASSYMSNFQNAKIWLFVSNPQISISQADATRIQQIVNRYSPTNIVMVGSLCNYGSTNFNVKGPVPSFGNSYYPATTQFTVANSNPWGGNNANALANNNPWSNQMGNNEQFFQSEQDQNANGHVLQNQNQNQNSNMGMVGATGQASALGTGGTFAAWIRPPNWPWASRKE